MKSKMFYVAVSSDKEEENIKTILGIYENKKEAKKAMMDQATKDLTRGRYYFYFLKEEITHEIYPSTETSE